MSKYEKLLIHARNNPRNVDHRDAIYLAERFGYTRRKGKSGHQIYKKEGYPLLTFTKQSDGTMHEYQVRQLLAIIDPESD